MAKQNETRNKGNSGQKDLGQGQDQDQLSSQDPAEGRPDVPKGKGSDKGREYDTDKYYKHQKAEGGKSTEEPAEGREDVDVI